MNYHCKSCKNIIGNFNEQKYRYRTSNYCESIPVKNKYFLSYLNCKNCKKFVGLVCYNVCDTCNGKDPIFGEKNLFKWFIKYKNTISFSNSYCKICNKTTFRFQYWFFDELTFYK